MPGNFIQNHSLLLFLSGVTSHILMQGIHNCDEVLNEVSVVSNEPDKTLDGCVCYGFRIFGDGFQVIPAWPYTFQ